MRTLLAGAIYFPRLFLRGTLRLLRFRARSRRLLSHLVLSGLMLFALSGYVRGLTHLDDFLLDGIQLARTYWQDCLEFLDRAPWLVVVLVRGFDVALVWLFLRAVATFHLRIPSYLDALVVLRVSLRQGVVWTSRMQLRLLLALPVAVTLTIILRDQWSLWALAFALFSLWYLGAAFNSRSVDKMMELLHRASLSGRNDLNVMDDGGDASAHEE